MMNDQTTSVSAINKGKGDEDNDSNNEEEIVHGLNNNNNNNNGNNWRGVLVSCNRTTENKSIREVIQILTEYYEKGEQQQQQQQDNDNNNNNNNNNSNNASSSTTTKKYSSIESELVAEIESLKDEKNHVFKPVKVGCTGMVFIKFLNHKVEPQEIMHRILADVERTKKMWGRYTTKVVPIDMAVEYCHMLKIGPYIKSHFPVGGSEKYAIIYGSRNNDSAKREDIIPLVAKMVPESHSVDLSNPDKIILIEVIQKLFAVCVLNGEDYRRFKKYNVRLVADLPEQIAPKKEKKENVKRTNEEIDGDEKDEEKKEHTTPQIADSTENDNNKGNKGKGKKKKANPP